MSLLFVGIFLVVLGVLFFGLILTDIVDMNPVIGSVIVIALGSCCITNYCVTEMHQDIIDKAGIELDLKEEKKDKEVEE
jgi:hypothetical protein